MERRIIYIFCGFLIAMSVVYPLNLTDRMRVPIYFTLQSGIAYDSNYLKLSASEINEVSLYPALLGDSETVSSLIAKNSLNIKYNPFFFTNHETQFRFRISFNNYFSSSDKSYSSYGISIAQHLGKYEWLKFSYSYMPGYYLRDYRDRDEIIMNVNQDEILTSCYFSQGSSTLSYSKWLSIKRTWVEGKINYKTQYYNPTFTEFDLNIISYGLSVYSKFFKTYYLSIVGIQASADNPTYQNGLSSTEQIDRGYKQTDISISLQKNKIDWILLQTIGCKYSNTIRNYSSQHSSDNLHKDRSHTENKIKMWVGGTLNTSLDYKLYLSTRVRTTKATIEWVEELKDFNKYEILLLFSYHFSSDILY